MLKNELQLYQLTRLNMGFVTSLWDPIWAEESGSTKNFAQNFISKKSFNHFCKKIAFFVSEDQTLVIGMPIGMVSDVFVRCDWLKNMRALSFLFVI